MQTAYSEGNIPNHPNFFNKCIFHANQIGKFILNRTFAIVSYSLIALAITSI